MKIVQCEWAMWPTRLMVFPTKHVCMSVSHWGRLCVDCASIDVFAHSQPCLQSFQQQASGSACADAHTEVTSLDALAWPTLQAAWLPPNLRWRCLLLQAVLEAVALQPVPRSCWRSVLRWAVSLHGGLISSFPGVNICSPWMARGLHDKRRCPWNSYEVDVLKSVWCLAMKSQRPFLWSRPFTLPELSQHVN